MKEIKIAINNNKQTKQKKQNDVLEGLLKDIRGVVVRRDRAVGPDFFSQIQVLMSRLSVHTLGRSSAKMFVAICMNCLQLPTTAYECNMLCTALNAL